jgi:hypothetical protein
MEASPGQLKRSALIGAECCTMNNGVRLRILEKDPNKRGDLFGRLAEDLFAALGYERFRINIHKSGREIDLQGRHRTEPRYLVAECKATEKPIGGDDLNKFFGSVDMERRKLPDGYHISAYFVSLSGFTETAIEQELDAATTRFVRVNGPDMIRELIAGRIIVPEQNSMEIAGRCAAGQDPCLTSEAAAELVAHELGWIWIVYFGKNRERTHFALVHADGQALAPRLADSIVKADKAVGGKLYKLAYLGPADQRRPEARETELARQAYVAYVGRECGEIQLEGLPADQEVGSRRLKLENIFVPLHLVGAVKTAGPSGPEDSPRPGRRTRRTRKRRAKLPPTKEERKSIGEVLQKASRLAILGLPGGGKSTLLKRLATAYAFPERRKLIHDELPEREWLPLFIRCRQLGSLVRSPIMDILGDLRKRAEIPDELEGSFGELVVSSLQSGNALLLIDGLDEIADDGSRVAFVQQLRTFLAVYPAAGAVISCREAGFRVVAASLSGHCREYKLADLDDQDIRSLTVGWHKEVVGQRPSVAADAEKLADAIIASDRVKRLAQNPLLLTTLLLVKRWVGQLPTKRSVLYGKAVEVLLMTWNVEGHEPMDPEEALPQLEFAAFAMMRDGTKQITGRKLKGLLIAARKQMPEILEYTKVSVQDFIDRVELRSSLLMQSGLEVEDGTLTAVYEFRHLTFQEYLAARAIVNGHYPERSDADSLVAVLGPHLDDEGWKEVTLLSAVLAGRNAQPLLEHLIREIASGTAARERLAMLLAECVADEVQASPKLLQEAMRWIARLNDPEVVYVGGIIKSKYGEMFKRTCMEEFSNAESDLLSIGSTLSEILAHDGNSDPAQADATVQNGLSSDDPLEVAVGCLVAMDFGFSHHQAVDYPKALAPLMTSWLVRILPLVASRRPCLALSALWAFVWLESATKWKPADHAAVLRSLLSTWRAWQDPDLRHLAAWAIVSLPIAENTTIALQDQDEDLPRFLLSKAGADREPRGDFLGTEGHAAIVTGFYVGKPWPPSILADLISTRFLGDPREEIVATGREMLHQMGRAGSSEPPESQAGPS